MYVPVFSNTAYSKLYLQKLMLVTYSDVADNYWILMTELRSWWHILSVGEREKRWLNKLKLSPTSRACQQHIWSLTTVIHIDIPCPYSQTKSKTNLSEINKPYILVKSCLTLPALCIIFLLLGYYQNPYFYNAAVLGMSQKSKIWNFNTQGVFSSVILFFTP